MTQNPAEALRTVLNRLRELVHGKGKPPRPYSAESLVGELKALLSDADKATEEAPTKVMPRKEPALSDKGSGSIK